MAGRLNWRGEQVKARAHRAARLGIDETTALMVAHSKQTHSFRNITGALESSIQMRPAIELGGRILGFFGSFAILYAIFVELGTRFMAARPFLRPSFDLYAPTLASRIKAHFSSL